MLSTFIKLPFSIMIKTLCFVYFDGVPRPQRTRHIRGGGGGGGGGGGLKTGFTETDIDITPCSAGGEKSRTDFKSSWDLSNQCRVQQDKGNNSYMLSI